MKRLALAAILLCVLAAIAGAAFVRFGLYDISASVEHLPVTYRLMHYTMQQSVRVRAHDVPPPDLGAPARIADGLRHYTAHCVQCHGAPGVPPDPLAIGLMPPPANLVAAARTWSAAELYWVIRRGIKMTAMPAWDYKLSEQETWNVVALLQRLPQLSPQQYQALAQQAVAPAPRPAAAVRAGDAEAGRRAVTQYLCATCHRIPHVAGAYNDVGPPLDGIARRRFIGGVLPNTPENMVRWLRNPRAVDPQSAMPDLGLSEQDARDIAAFLYTLPKPD